jgi:hypothetical protein
MKICLSLLFILVVTNCAKLNNSNNVNNANGDGKILSKSKDSVKLFEKPIYKKSSPTPEINNLSNNSGSSVSTSEDDTQKSSVFGNTINDNYDNVSKA